MLNNDYLFSPDTTVRYTARELYGKIKDMPILSPHGHVPAKWFAENKPFLNPAEFLIIPDHYVFRLLYSQGISLEELGIQNIKGKKNTISPREIWKKFAQNYYLFAGTPSGIWMNYVLQNVFKVKKKLSVKTADEIYNIIDEKLKFPEFLPRNLYDQFSIEVLSTTDGACDSLEFHKHIKESGWSGRIIPCFRPDDITNLAYPKWRENIRKLAQRTNQEIKSYSSFIQAIKKRRADFIKMGATATDHGVNSAYTNELPKEKAEEIFKKALEGDIPPEHISLFTAHMLMEMAAMSVEDGLVMQIHAGPYRNHNKTLYNTFGADKGADIPVSMEYTRALHPLLNKYGNNKNFTVVVFTLDESTYSRELAPLAGHYPAMYVGPAWWFHDSFQGMKRFRQSIWETASIYNTTGFIDDTRAFLSIPARHDVARRVDCNYLAELVAHHVLDMDDAECMAKDLTYNLSKRVYKL